MSRYILLVSVLALVGCESQSGPGPLTRLG